MGGGGGRERRRKKLAKVFLAPTDAENFGKTEYKSSERGSDFYPKNPFVEALKIETAPLSKRRV